MITLLVFPPQSIDIWASFRRRRSITEESKANFSCLFFLSVYLTSIHNFQARTIAYCMKSGYGTRLIPDGTITGAHFLKTPSYVQVTGVGHLKNLNIQVGDAGGELDPHGATGAGNPVGGLVYTRAYTGNWERIYESMSCRWFLRRSQANKGP